MAMTLRLPPELDAELRAAAEDDHRSLHQTVVLAIETFLALRETAEIKADSAALRSLVEAREAVTRGETYTTDEIRAALAARTARST